MKITTKIIKAYYRLFYFFFKIEKTNHRGREESDKSATLMALAPICLLCFCNLLTLLYIVSRFIIALPRPSSLFYCILAALVVGFNFFLFFYKCRYLSIKEMFIDENDEQKFKRTFWCILFILASLFSSAILIGVFGLAWKG